MIGGWNLLYADRRYGVVLVDEPDQNGTPVEPGPRIRYTPEDTLSSRRVRVYDGPVAESANVLYDTGWLPGDYNTVDVPLGVIVDLDETYYVQVQAEFDNGKPGLSEMRAFTPGWEATNDPAPTLTIVKLDQCNAPATLPRVRLRWEFEVSDAAMTLVKYLIMRQEDDGVWELLAEQTDTSYTDFEVGAYQTYRYAVLPVIQYGGITLVSDLPDPPQEVRLEFDGLWLHKRSDPIGLNMRYDSWTPGEQANQPIVIQRVWGRIAPVAITSEQLYRTWNLAGPPAAFDKKDWDRVLALLADQFNDSATYVARFGRQRTIANVVMEQTSRTGSRDNFVPTIKLTEVSLEERFG